MHKITSALLLAGLLPAQNSSFSLTTTSAERYAPAFLGNGNFSLVTRPLGVSPAESYMIKVYDHAPGDTARIARLPAWNAMDVWNGTAWLADANTRDLNSYRQVLNLYDGTLGTRYEWTDHGRIIAVDVQAFTSRANPNLAAVRLNLTPRFSGPLKVSLPLKGWPEPLRLPPNVRKVPPELRKDKMRRMWYPGHMIVRERQAGAEGGRGLMRLLAQVEGSATTVAEAAAVEWSPSVPSPEVARTSHGALASIDLSFLAKAGETYTFTKYVGVASSFESPDPAGVAGRVAVAARSQGYNRTAAASARVWHELWKADIRVEGDPELQRAIHATLFYLMSSIRSGVDFPIAPMGLSSAGYNGHLFWDGDVFLFPVLLALQPEMAKSFVMYRCRTLEEAKANARASGCSGAMYPSEADEYGREATPSYAVIFQGRNGEIHNTGDVALAVWQYYLATGDRKWLRDYGYPVLEQTAAFWVSRLEPNPAMNRYEIRNVVSVDESSKRIDNEAFTNAIARKNIEIAVEAARLLGKPINAEWEKIARGIYIPYDEADRFHPEFEGAPAWQGAIGHVVPLLAWPAEMPMSATARRNDLENALKSVAGLQGRVVAMMPSIYPTVAAEFGDRARLARLLHDSYAPYLHTPFYAMAEFPGDDDRTVFLTGAGFLQQFIYGYAGLRLGPNGFARKHTPVLPEGIRRLTIRNLSSRGARRDIVVAPGR